MQTSYFKEISLMMHGFGDSSEPRADTVRLVEAILLKQLQGILYEATVYADRRDAKIISHEDIVFVMRHNPSAVQRLLRHLKSKDSKKHYAMELKNDVSKALLEATEVVRNKKNPIIEFIESIDETGELSNTDAFDPVKYAREVRADRLSLTLKENKYKEYFRARCTSFVAKDAAMANSLRDWIIQSADIKMSTTCLDVIAYLAHETLAQIVDLSLVVRNDMCKMENDPLTAVSVNSYCNPVLFEVSPPVQEGQSALTPGEVREAMRRFEMSNVGKMMCAGRNKNKYLAC